jgi:thiamine pyrophosphate-dependent acetolactate synthase large subunit-like protein
MPPLSAASSPKVYSAVANALLELQPAAFFGLMGEDTALLTAELSEAGVTYVAARHESGAVGMAEGYAWASGELGICLVTRGPGFTNALTALRTAVRAQARLLLITGEAPTTRWYLPDPKAVDQRLAAAAIGLEYHEARAPEDVPGQLARAMASAQAGRVAALAVVTNVLNGPVAGAAPPPNPMTSDAPAISAPRGAEVATAAGLLAGSRRPLILAGRGAAHAREALEELAARTGALLGTTLPARDLFLGSSYDLGVVGGFATDPAASVLAQVDCVVVFGASLTDFTTAERTLLRDATAIHVDVDPGKIGAYYPVEAGIVGDAEAVARRLLAALPENGRLEKPFHEPETRAELDRPLYEGSDETTRDGIDPRIVATTLDALLPEQRAIIVDTGRFSGAPSRYMRSSGIGTFRFTGDFGAIGSALGPALGAAVARPELPTVLFVGDGGLMMSLPDLETAARHAIPLVVVVMNDRAFGAERHVLAAAGVDERHAEFADTDFAGIARAMGVEAYEIRRAADLEAVEPVLAGRTAPLLLDCKLRPDLPPPRVKQPGPPKTVPRA